MKTRAGLRDVDTNRAMFRKLTSAGGSFYCTGGDLAQELDITLNALSGLLHRFKEEGLLRIVGNQTLRNKRMYLLTDDSELLARHAYLLKERAVITKSKVVVSRPTGSRLECTAKRYIRERFQDKGLNRDVAVCVLKDFTGWVEGK